MASFVLQGRLLHDDDLAQLCGLIAAHPAWSRRRLSVALAQAWHWRTPTGQLKDMAARTLMLKLEQRGLIVLPPRRRTASRRLPLVLELPLAPPAALITGTLRALMPLTLDLVTGTHPAFSHALATHHYRGYGGPVGEHLAYMVRDRQGREVACLLFGAAAWKTKPRDGWIGWNDATRARHLHLIANHARFLILPWVRVPHLASHVLGRITRRLAADWHARYGHPVHLLETFVERDRFRGTCYRAANWIPVGQTQGRSRQDRDRTRCVPVKDIYLYALTPRVREELCRVDA
jgi:hypothetical protein